MVKVIKYLIKHMNTPGWSIGPGHRDSAETIGLVWLKLLGIKFTVPSASRAWSLEPGLCTDYRLQTTCVLVQVSVANQLQV